MSLTKKVIAALLCVAMVVSFGACSSKDTSWSMKVDDQTISAGLYIYYLNAALGELIEDTGIADAKMALESDYQDTDASDWVISRAKELVQEYVAVKKLFEDLGLTIDEETQDSIDTQADTVLKNNEEQFTHNGIGKVSIVDAVTSSYRKQLLMDHYYGDDGVSPVDTEEVKEYALENYAKFRYFVLLKVDADGALSEEELAKVKAQADEYVRQVNEEGADFNEIVDEVDKENFGTEVTEEEKEDPTRHDKYLSKNSESFPPEIVEGILNAEYQKATLIDYDSYYFIAYRLDLFEDLNWFIQNYNIILSEMKSPEMEERVQEIMDQQQVTVNEDTIKKYAPEKMEIKVSLF